MAKAVLFLVSEGAPFATSHPLVAKGGCIAQTDGSENREQSPWQRAIVTQDRRKLTK
jgi:hypothetical protein